VDTTLRAALELCPVGRLFREAKVAVNVIPVVSPTARSS
jgi:hypothetical protein